MQIIGKVMGKLFGKEKRTLFTLVKYYIKPSLVIRQTFFSIKCEAICCPPKKRRIEYWSDVRQHGGTMWDNWTAWSAVQRSTRGHQRFSEYSERRFPHCSVEVATKARAMTRWLKGLVKLPATLEVLDLANPILKILVTN